METDLATGSSMVAQTYRGMKDSKNACKITPCDGNIYTIEHKNFKLYQSTSNF